MDDRCVPFGANAWMRALYVSATYSVPLAANAADCGNQSSPGPEPGGHTRRGGQAAMLAGASPPPIRPKGTPAVALIRETMFHVGAVAAIVPPSGDRATSYGFDHTWYTPRCRPVSSSTACTLRLYASAT